MKKFGKGLLTLSVTAAMVATSLVGFTACSNNGGGSTTTQPSAKDVFSMAAASGASFIAGDSSNAMSAKAAAQQEVQRPIDDVTFDTIKTYLGMFDDMLVGGITQESSASDREGYETKLSISIAGKDAYTLYYTETTLSGTVVDESDDDDDVEEATTLKGILVDGETELEINGKRTVEVDEDGEKETEVEFTTKGEGLEKVKVTQTHEVDPSTGEEETEFEYEVTDKNGEVVEYSIEWEFEDGSHEMEVGIEKGNVEVEYSVKKLSDTKLEISYEVEQDDAETESTFYAIKNEDGTYNFEYENGYDKDVNINVHEDAAPAPEEGTNQEEEVVA